MKTGTRPFLMMSLAASLAHAETAKFDQATVGQAPPGWTVAITGKGGPTGP